MLGGEHSGKVSKKFIGNFFFLSNHLGFAFGESEVSFASQCVFTTLPLGEEAVESMGGVTDYLIEQIG